MPHRTAIDDYSGPYTPGLDFSAYQADVDYARVARSELYLGKGARRRSLGQPRFAIIRAADGVQTRRDSAPDPLAVRHLQGCVDAGLLVDVYVYVRAWHEAAAQVELVLEVIRMASVRVRTVWLDLEGRPDDPTTPDTDESSGLFWAPDGTAKEDRVDAELALECVRGMRRLLERRGLRVGIYSGVTWHWMFAQKGVDVSDLHDCPFWTPYYTTGPRPKLPVGPRGEPWPWPYADIWQTGGSHAVPGTVAGLRGIVDVNLYRGDEAALARFWDPSGVETTPGFRSRAGAVLEGLAVEAKQIGDGHAVEVLRGAAGKLG